MSEKPPFDPFDMWREFFAKFENDANSLAANTMQSDKVAQAMGQFAQVSAEMRQGYEKALDNYFKTLRLPCSNNLAAIEERLKRLEDKIDMLMPMDLREPPETRPRRTRKPPTGDGKSSTDKSDPHKD